MLTPLWRWRTDGGTKNSAAHHLIQRLKALQPQLSFPSDWFPSESDYFKIRFAYLKRVSVSEMHSSSTTVVLGNLLRKSLGFKVFETAK